MPKMITSPNKLLKNFILFFIFYYIIITITTAIVMAIIEVSLETPLENIPLAYIQIAEDFILLLTSHILAIFFAIRSTFKTKLIMINDIDKFFKRTTIFFTIVVILYIAFSIIVYDLNYLSICTSITAMLIYITMFWYVKKVTFKNISNNNFNPNNHVQNHNFTNKPTRKNKPNKVKKPKKIKQHKKPYNNNQTLNNHPGFNQNNFNNHYQNPNQNIPNNFHQANNQNNNPNNNNYPYNN